jgi:peptidyl-prolyl cis-trans isomerase D
LLTAGIGADIAICRRHPYGPGKIFRGSPCVMEPVSLMMTAIRNAAANWLGRVVLIVVMGLLIVSFAIWGIGDIFRGGSARNVASGGGVTVSAEQFRTAFNTELQGVQRQLRRPVTTQELRAFGLDREVLNRLIDEAVMGQKAKALGLAADDAQVTKSILEADVFKRGGLFDRDLFLSVLQQNGLSEVAFRSQQQDFLLRQQLLTGLVGGLSAPNAFAEAFHQYRDEERSIEVVAVPPEKVPDAANPDQAALRQFHNERRSEFRTAETRKAAIIAIEPAKLAAGLTLNETDLRTFYDQQVLAGRFGAPERRRVQRVLFDTEAEAKAAGEKIATGTGFEALIAERKLAEADIDLGLKARNELPEALREAAFTLAQGAVSAPIRDPFGFVLVRVTAIEASRAVPFEAVRGQVETEARAERIRTDSGIRRQVDDLMRKIEDQRIAGKALAEIAPLVDLPLTVIEGIDRQGIGPDGRAAPLPGGKEVIDAIFSSDIGLDNEAIHLRDGTHIWFEVNAVDAARDKNFEEVAEEIRLRYLADQKSRALGEFANTLLRRLESGEKLATLAGELGVSVQTFSGMKRNAREAILGQNGIERAFAGEIGKAVTAVAPDGVGRFLIIPTASSLLPFDVTTFDRAGLTRQLAQGYSDDIFRQYVAGIRKSAGVSINETLLNQALGQAQ